MRYETGGAFRMALESRLRARSTETAEPLVRLRKTVAFDRLLARLVRSDDQGVWLLKGGFALQLRLHSGARTTKDMDMLFRDTQDRAHARLLQAARRPLGDWFEFEITPPKPASDAGGLRFSVNSRLDSREFESFHVDVGFGDPVIGEPESLAVTDLLEFAGIPATTVDCYPLSQHLAEKIHALTRDRGVRENSRAKDLVDVVIIAEQHALDSRQAIDALVATFAARDARPAPGGLHEPPTSWRATYGRLADDVGVDARTLSDGFDLARRLVDPLLERTATGQWDPRAKSWG